MADASLDDFFAKKDKSKKKSKSKTTPAEILEKQQEDAKPRKEKKKRDKDKSQTSSSTSQGAPVKVEDDEEWIDFQEETEKDYSGLRISNLQIKKEEEDDRDENEEIIEGEDGEPREKQKVASGPWDVSGQPPQVTGPAPALGGGAAPEPPPQPPKPKEEPAAGGKVPGKYVPPGVRAAMSGGGSSTSSSQQLRRKKEAPNIKSEVDFPTLGGMGKSEFSQEGSPEANYEHPGSKRGMQLSLGNKFAALQD